MYIQTALQDISPRERFLHRFATVDKYISGETKADIFIIDGNEDIITELAEDKRDGMWVIYYGKEPVSFDNIDEYWPDTFSERTLSFVFSALLDKVKLKKDFRLHKNYLDTVIDNTPDLVWFKDIKGSHLKVNTSFCKAVNKTKMQVEGRGHYYIWDITPDDYSKGEYVCLESEDMVIEAQKPMVFDENVKTKDGMRLFITTKIPIFDEFQNIMGTCGIAKDITELSNISREMGLFIENMPFGVILSDDDDKILNINTRMENFCGIKRKELIGKKAYYGWERKVDIIEDTPEKLTEMIETKIDGERKILEMTKIHFTDVFKKPMGIMRIFRDVTSEHDLKVQVEHNANTDFLTGLYNRRYFYRYVNTQCIGKPMGIVLLDLDNFKGVNDTYGHKAGDDALVLTAQKLNEAFEGDLIVRNGGDEFIVLIADSDVDRIVNKVRSAVSSLNSVFKERDEFKNVSVSAGISFTEGFSGDVDEILQKSDMAMYSVKRDNKGSCKLYAG
jgi:diguanylate cyclase (GGDEF)-like protein/PAS domain S-box-containing protein